MAGTGRVDYLDGIRALAIGAVLCLHWLSWYSPLFHGGSVGVDVFFVLSGFIITTMLWPDHGLRVGGFLWRRVTRLYPALLGLVVGCVVLAAVVPWSPQSPVEVARRAALVLSQASSLWAAGEEGSFWLPALQPFGQTWSLAVEWYFYALWPLLLLAARRRGWSPGRLARWVVVVALALYLGSLPAGAHVFYFGPTARAGELLAGAALALWYAERGRPRGVRRGATPAAVVALVAVGLYTLVGPDGHGPAYRLVGVPVAVTATVVLIHTGYAHPTGPVHRLLAHRWSALVGRHSYSLYLWHVVPFLLLQDAPAPKLLLGPVAVAAAVLLSALSYRLLERPFLRARGDALVGPVAAVGSPAVPAPRVEAHPAPVAEPAQPVAQPVAEPVPGPPPDLRPSPAPPASPAG